MIRIPWHYSTRTTLETFFTCWENCDPLLRFYLGTIIHSIIETYRLQQHKSCRSEQFVSSIYGFAVDGAVTCGVVTRLVFVRQQCEPQFCWICLLRSSCACSRQRTSPGPDHETRFAGSLLVCLCVHFYITWNLDRMLD